MEYRGVVGDDLIDRVRVFQTENRDEHPQLQRQSENIFSILGMSAAAARASCHRMSASPVRGMSRMRDIPDDVVQGVPDRSAGDTEPGGERLFRDALPGRKTPLASDSRSASTTAEANLVEGERGWSSFGRGPGGGPTRSLGG